MRTVTETKEIYTYDELSDSAKENAKQYILENYHTPELFTDFIVNDLEIFFGINTKHTNLDVEYSLNYSQGDGLNIYGTINVKTILDFMGSNVAGALSEKYAGVLTDDEKETILKWRDEYCDIHYNGIGIITIPRSPSNYCYCMADSIEFADDWATELYYYGIEDTDILFTLEKAVQKLFGELCAMYKSWGYDYFYELSDFEMNEICDANNIEFDEYGSVY